MPFRSGKKRSGVRIVDSSRSTTRRVSQAGRGSKGLGGRSRSGPRGSESNEAAISTPVISAITTTTATATTPISRIDGTFFFVVSENAVRPSIAQIKAGDDAGDVAGVDAGNGAVVANPVVTAITGLTTATEYYFYAYQEIDSTGSAVVSSGLFTTL